MSSDFPFRFLMTQAWQITVLAVIVAAVVNLTAKNRPQLAHLFWLVVVIKCVMPPLWGHSLGMFSQIQSMTRSSMLSMRAAPASESEELADSSYAVRALSLSADLVLTLDRSTQAPQMSETFGPGEGRGSAPSSVPATVCCILVSGMLASVVVLGWRFVSCMRRIRLHRVIEFDAEVGSLVTDLSKQLKLRRVPRFIVSDIRFGPAVLGIFRHLIVLPKCLVAGAADGQQGEHCLRPILAHELLHIRRGDLWTGILQAVVQCLWWFHPAVWIVNRRLSRETERCCDDQVIAELQCSPVQYARSLLSVIECRQNLPPVPVFPGMKPVEITSQRLERIMSPGQGCRPGTSWWSYFIILLFAAVVLPGAATGQLADDALQPTESNPAVEENVEVRELLAAEPGSGKIMLGSAVDSDAGVTGQILQDAGAIRILGAVRDPGFYEIPRGQAFTLLSAVELAGGVRDPVDDRVILRRPTAPGGTSVLLLSLKKARQDATTNPALTAGDVLVFEQLAIPGGPSAVDREMQKNLNQRVTFSFVDVPVMDVLRQIAVDNSLNIALDRNATKVGGGADRQTVSLEVENVSLKSALKLLCEQLDLTFEVENEVIMIRQKQAEAPRLVTRFYAVSDLVVPVPKDIEPVGGGSRANPLPPRSVTEKSSAEVDFTPLVELIRTTVEPDLWGERGGQIEPCKQNLSLVIRQSDDVHDRVVELLTQLRAIQDRQIITRFRVLQFESKEQIEWLQENVVLHKGHFDHPSALLPDTATNQVLSEMSQRGSRLSAPTITAFVGQSANLRQVVSPDIEIVVNVTGIPVDGNNLIGLSYGIAVGPMPVDVPSTVDRIVGNGQTLLLDLTEGSAAESAVSTAKTAYHCGRYSFDCAGHGRRMNSGHRIAASSLSSRRFC